ncbi:conserved Plasmodium protein, unknown function [Plasmodium vinckei brucechwatti]|uniref:G domain-containing protein n=1 Tax=Plasmodium vinckei brucechwatti TaxID=119398 RepID=A0A6V7SVW7_PLAVN|nr:conserved Plasmodium protein, unknown function [Plasmodium vinckei brucechwatti]
MLLKLLLFFTINICFIYTKCNSYYIRRKFFENLFFLNYNSNNLNNFDINGSKKIKPLGKKRDFFTKLKNKEYNERYQNGRRKYKHVDKKFPACFFLSNEEKLDKLDTQCNDQNRRKCFYVPGKYKNKGGSLNTNTRICSATFDSIFKDNFNENDRLKKSELISILACICTNIVIQYLKIKEEKKTENFDYSFDYSVMNILKLVNFEYDVNEEITKKKKKKYKKKKNEYIDKKNKTSDEVEDDEYVEEVNIDIDNKNTKEEDEKLNEYIKKLEYNTMELNEIEPYIDLFFGKKTYKNVFIKHNIDIQKIHNVLNEALFDKCKEKENVIQLQKFVEEEEKTLKKKKINVRNAKTFNDYMHNFNALEERRNIEEVENILYDDDDMNDLMENETVENKDKKKKKKKKRENSQISKWKKENKYGGKLELDPSNDDDGDGDGDGDDDDDDESWEYERGRNEDEEDERGRNEDEEDESGRNEDEEYESGRNEDGDGEKINSLSYILIKNCDNLEKEKNEDQKEDKSDIILIKFIYDNKYKCEFRTDIGVIVYDVENLKNLEDLEKIKMINIEKEPNDNIIDSVEKNKLSEDNLKFIENINLFELYSLPYKKRYKKKQKIIKEINQKINYDNIEETDKRGLLYTYLRIWDDDLHFYELNKFDIKMFEKDKNNGEEVDEKKKYNFLQNYNYSDKEEILITSDIYNKIVSSEQNLKKTNKNIYDLLSNDKNFFNNDFISFNLNIYINNRKVINNIDDLINILKPFNCYFSKNILNYLIKIKNEKKEFSFLSSKEFLNNYTFDEKDELFSVNKILDKCKVESRYINLFGKDENGNFSSNRISKLFVFPITSKCRLKKYKFIKNGESNIFDTRKGMDFGGEKWRDGIPIYSIIDDNKKNKRKNREHNREKSREENKKTNENSYLTNIVEDEDTDFSKEIDKELIDFENLNNIIKLKDENKEDIEKGKKNEKPNVVEKNYFKKMIEKQKKINDFLSLEHMKENIKKHINIVDLDGAIKYFTNEKKEDEKGRKFNNANDINEEERDEFNYNEVPHSDKGISKIEEIELDESIKKILQDNNIHMHRLDTMGNENKVSIEKKKEEKEKINNFFKDMKAQVKISNDTCVGCGISFQTIDKKRLGYLKNHIYEKVMTDEENSDKDSILKEIYEENEKGKDENADENYKLEFEEIMKSTKQHIQKQSETNKGGVNSTEMEYIEEEGEMEDNKPYICERCFDLKYKNSIKNNLIINYSNNNEISAHDFEKYVINIFKKKCFIIYIVDILDLYIYSNLQKLFKIYKKLHSDKKKVEGFYFCINKIDLLKGYKEFTVKTYIHNFLKSHKINILFNNIFLVSAKTGYNVKKLIYTAYMRSKNAFMKKKKKKKKEDTEDLSLAGEDDEEVDEQNEESVEEEDKEIGDHNEEYKDFMSELYENDENKKIMEEYERKTRKKKNPKNVNLYIVGNANSGKSTLINYLLKSLKKEKNMNSNNSCNNFLISSSIIPGTTLKNIKIKLNNNLTINDTPGIISNNSMLSYLNFDEMKYVVCTKLKKKIPSIYINENDYIFIGGLVYINILNIKKYYSIMSFFMSDKIPIIKRKRFSKDPKEFLKKRIQSGYLYPPFSVDRFNEINDFKKCYFNINNPYINIDNSSYDIHIQGLGCITFYSFQNLEFDLYTLKNVDVIGRPSLMPYHKKYGMLDFSVKKKI